MLIYYVIAVIKEITMGFQTELELHQFYVLIRNLL